MIELRTPSESGLGDVVNALRRWQREDAPLQLHPGALGWSWRFGAAHLSSSLRTWGRDGEVVAIGYLDSPEVLRMTVAPEAWNDDELARHIVADLSATKRAVLPAAKVAVEVPDGTRVKELLSTGVWHDGDRWTPLRLDLTATVRDPQLAVEVVESTGQVSECTAVHRSAWGSQRFTDELWRTMAAGAPFEDARCLLARDESGVAVATLTVWSAGPGKPGLIEPLGVHADHRRRGYGVAICLAAGAHLRAMGSSSVAVCTPSSLDSAVATYLAAGYERRPERLDRSRDA